MEFKSTVSLRYSKREPVRPRRGLLDQQDTNLSPELEKEFDQFMKFTKNKFNVNLLQLTNQGDNGRTPSTPTQGKDVEYYFRKYVETKRLEELQKSCYFSQQRPENTK